MFKYRCPNCSVVLEASENQAGQQVECSQCSALLEIPTAPAKTEAESTRPNTPARAPSPPADVSDKTICICGKCKHTFFVGASSTGSTVQCVSCSHSIEIPEKDGIITSCDTMTFTCSACGRKYCVLSKYAGKKFKCLACKQPCPIPIPQAETQEDPIMEALPLDELELMPEEE